ncbi:hypothetical protein [Stackebrandtia nassauensis]|uniref:Uncharacterized protein n=1 Tax=Stackebrandtia nassauensis (strain DSM 44728 / CIP 108903 / NRRL B-16338 / NBRC 102104 / LLR-40K-21) TaxID=446470 RepID=D3PV76_STANL|nr:hypothetical protein [Stackebrandtia nassauensis]ADD41129.1 hypothetical protein Snas_1423 [Stackebrandtia nassauensis DSM 44728]
MINPRPGVALVAVEPSGELYFSANIVVTTDALPTATELERWQDDSDGELELRLPDYVLLDRETTADGRVRRLAHYEQPDCGPVTMEQWAWLYDGIGYTITASVATPAYDGLADVFARVAEGFTPGEVRA